MTIAAPLRLIQEWLGGESVQRGFYGPIFAPAKNADHLLSLRIDSYYY